MWPGTPNTNYHISTRTTDRSQHVHNDRDVDMDSDDHSSDVEEPADQSMPANRGPQLPNQAAQPPVNVNFQGIGSDVQVDLTQGMQLRNRTLPATENHSGIGSRQRVEDPEAARARRYEREGRRVEREIDEIEEEMRESRPRLVDGGDQDALERASRVHFARSTGRKTRDLADDDVFEGTVAEQQELAQDFASSLKRKHDPDYTQFNTWSGSGRERAEEQPGFVMQETEQFAAAIWETRNVAGFKDSSTKWPWDPSYHMAMAKWLEEQPAWPSRDQIRQKLCDLRGAHNPNPKERLVYDDQGAEETGFNRKIGDSIFDPPSKQLASMAAKAMIPIRGFGLPSHPSARTTVQAQTEIPTYAEETIKLSQRFARLADRVRDLADDAPRASKRGLRNDASLLDQAATELRDAARGLQGIRFGDDNRLIGTEDQLDKRMRDSARLVQNARRNFTAATRSIKRTLENDLD